MIWPSGFSIPKQPLHTIEKKEQSHNISIEKATQKTSGASVKDLESDRPTFGTEEILLEKAPQIPFQEDLRELEQSADQVKQYMTLGEILASTPPTSFVDWIFTNREKISREFLNGPPSQEEQDLSYEDVSPALLRKLGLAGLLIGTEEQINDQDIYLRLTTLLPDTKDQKLLYYRQALYYVMQNYKEELKEAYGVTKDPAIKDTISSLSRWLKKHKERSGMWKRVKTEKVFETIGTALRIPLLLMARALGGLRYIDAVGGVATMGAGNVLKLGVNVFDYVKLLRQSHVNKKWRTKYHEKEPILDKTTPEGQSEGTAYLTELLKKRSENENRLKEICRPECTKLLQEVIFDSLNFEEAKKTLSEKGIHIEAEINTLTELKAFLEDPQNQEHLLTSYARNQDAIQISVRNGLKTCEASKLIQMRKFFNWKLALGALKITMTFVFGAVLIALNVLILTSVISVPQFVLPIIAVSFLIGALVVGAAGLVYFYRKNPNRFKELVKGLGLRILIYQIPKATRGFFLKRKKQKQLDQLAKTYAIRAKLREISNFLEQNRINTQRLPEELQKTANAFETTQKPSNKIQRYQDQLEKLEDQYRKKLHKLETEIEKRSEEIYKLEKKVQYWKSKKAPLKAKLQTSGVADFLKSSRLAKDKEGEPLDVSRMLVEGALINPELLDAETLHIFDRYYGIDIERKKAEGDPNYVDGIVSNLNTYFARTPAQFTKFIRERMAEIQDEESELGFFNPI